MEQPCIPSQRVDACKELLGGICTRKYHPVEAADISQYRIDFAKIFNGLNLYGWYLHRFGSGPFQSVDEIGRLCTRSGNKDALAE